MFASLYETLGQIGFGPDQVDLWEVWQAASVMGVRKKDAPEPPRRDLLAERIRREREGRPPLEAEAMKDAQVSTLLGVINPRT